MFVVPANDAVHKWTAVFKDGTSTSFGARGMDDYTITRDKEQRERYRARHKKDLASRDPRKAGLLSYHLLWGDNPNLRANIAAYERKFHV